MIIDGARGIITGLGQGGLPNSTITGANIADKTIERGKISSSDRGPDVACNHFQSIRYDQATHSGNNVTLMEFRVKRQNQANAVVFCGFTPIEGDSSNLIGERVIANGTSKFKSCLFRNSTAGGTDGQYGCIHYMGYFSQAQLGSNPNFNFIINYAPRDGSEQNPATRINPSRASQSDRSQNRTTKIQFLEFDNLTIIT